MPEGISLVKGLIAYLLQTLGKDNPSQSDVIEALIGVSLVLFVRMIKGIVRNGVVLNNCVFQIDDRKIAMEGGIPHGMEVVVIDIAFDN